MNIKYGAGKSEYGPGVDIELTGAEVATAIETYLTAHGIYHQGSRTILVNGELCRHGRVYVDPSGFVIAGGQKFDGKGPSEPEGEWQTVKVKRTP